MYPGSESPTGRKGNLWKMKQKRGKEPEQEGRMVMFTAQAGVMLKFSLNTVCCRYLTRGTKSEEPTSVVC